MRAAISSSRMAACWQEWAPAEGPVAGHAPPWQSLDWFRLDALAGKVEQETSVWSAAGEQREFLESQPEVAIANPTSRNLISYELATNSR